MDEMIIFPVMVLLSAFVSGMTGLGGGILLLAFMTPIFPASVLIPLHGVFQLFGNSTRVALSIKQVDVKILIMFTIGAAIGSLAGLPIDKSFSSDYSIIILAVAMLTFTWFPVILKSIEFRGKFFIVGAVSSFLSLFIGATGPLTAPFFFNSNLEKDSFVTTKAACQVPIHIFKIIIYTLSGFVIAEWYTYILLAIPALILGNFLGKLAIGKFDSKWYALIIKLSITVLVLRMVLKTFF